MPLVMVPTASIRRACCNRVSSRARSLSMACVQCIHDSIERHPQETELVRRRDAARAVDRIEAEGDAATFRAHIGRARPPPQTEGNACVLVISRREPFDTWNLDNSIDDGIEAGRESRRLPGPARRKAPPRLGPDV